MSILLEASNKLCKQLHRFVKTSWSLGSLLLTATVSDQNGCKAESVSDVIRRNVDGGPLPKVHPCSSRLSFELQN